jgi:thioesterase domain-containing protein
VRVLLLDAPVGRASGGLTAIANPPAQVARRAAIRAWLRVLPASTLPRERRYRALFLLAGRARVRYTPPAAAFPIALFHPAHSVMPDHWQIAADRLVTIAVAGNHYTMLEPPHASALAGAMADAIAGVRQP